MARVKREGSPLYSWTVPVIAAGATEIIHVPTEFPDSRKYEPLDSIEIANNEAANDLTLTINNQDARYVPAGTIRRISGNGIALWHIAVTNNGAGDTTLGKIIVTLQREPLTMDRWIAGR